MKNKDVILLEGLAKQVLEQRFESDIYNSAGDETSPIGPVEPEVLEIEIPASKFKSKVYSIVLDATVDIIRDNVRDIAEGGASEVMAPYWSVEDGLTTFDLQDAVETLSNFYGYEIASTLDPRLVNMLEADEPFTIRINNEDGEDIVVPSSDIDY